jgi:serine/threonine-protein kinase
MSSARIIRIGVIAHAMGLLDIDRFAASMQLLGPAPDPTRSLEEFWVQGGHLSAEQLALVLDALEGAPGSDRPTLPYKDGPPTAAPSSPQPRRIDVLPPEPTRVVRLESGPAESLNFNATMARPPGLPSSSRSEPRPLPRPLPLLAGVPSGPGPERYASRRLLGAGGMGQVFECIDNVLGRQVAVKRLRPEVATDPLAISMLEREARVIGSLEHPNIIPVYDAGYLDDTGPFYAMRLLERPSLEVLLRKLREGEPATTAEYGLGRLLRAFIQVCQAVDYAHSRGIIHCDLKPSNILLGSFGEVLVVDWGLAHSPDEGSAYRGGTPGYMAPEQFEPSTRPIDARTDVYALGAVLYEILTQRQAFPDQPSDPNAPRTMIRLLSPRRRPVSPLIRAPERVIPEELAEASMRALELEPEDRYPTTRALATAIELFLEGTKERERRELRARDLTEQGDGLAESYHELVESRPDRVAETNQLRASISPWEDAELKQTLWDAEDRQLVLDSLCIRTLQAAVAAYEQALDEVPGYEAARRGLARLYREELHRAHERRDDFDRVYFEGLMRQYEGDAAGSLGSVIRLAVTPEPVEVTLCHVQENNRRLVVAREEPLGVSPVEVTNLSTGSYIVRLSRPGFFDVLCPLLLRPGQDLSLEVDVRGASEMKPGEVFIPGGPALLGGDETNLNGRDLQEVNVPSFFIATFPVSFQEYLEFVASVFQTDPAQAHDFIPRNTDGTFYWDWNGHEFEPSRITRWGEDREVLLSLPAFGVDVACAEAYARWRSESTGRQYRLPTEWEWEKAARGTDGRRYPWGDRFDASFCKMRESRPGLPRPEPSGIFAADSSPYGVRDLAGGIAEWVLPPGHRSSQGVTTQLATRGGAWCDWRVDCYLGARRPYFVEERSARVGFRLVRDIREVRGADLEQLDGGWG